MDRSLNSGLVSVVLVRPAKPVCALSGRYKHGVLYSFTNSLCSCDMNRRMDVWGRGKVHIMHAM